MYPFGSLLNFFKIYKDIFRCKYNLALLMVAEEEALNTNALIKNYENKQQKKI